MSASTFPISAQALQDFLPHRPPLVWIDQVDSLTPTGGRCSLFFDPSRHDSETSGPRQSSLVEWMAQGFGFCQAARSQQGTEKAYLAALRDIEFCPSTIWLEFLRELKPGSPIQIRVEKLKALGPITLMRAEVWTQSEILLASGTLKIFIEQPHSRKV